MGKWKFWVCKSQKLNVLSSSNFQLSLFLMSTKSYLKFRTIRGTPQKWVGFGKPLLVVLSTTAFWNWKYSSWGTYLLDKFKQWVLSAVEFAAVVIQVNIVLLKCFKLFFFPLQFTVKMRTNQSCLLILLLASLSASYTSDCPSTEPYGPPPYDESEAAPAFQKWSGHCT